MCRWRPPGNAYFAALLTASVTIRAIGTAWSEDIWSSGASMFSRMRRVRRRCVLSPIAWNSCPHSSVRKRRMLIVWSSPCA